MPAVAATLARPSGPVVAVADDSDADAPDADAGARVAGGARDED
jgi:hypothetical protein